MECNNVTMETSNRQKVGRKGVQSLCVTTVPTIVLNTMDKNETTPFISLPHSRSAGELTMAGNGQESVPTIVDGQNSLCCGAESGTGHDESRTAINIYCSPRMSRRAMNLENSRVHSQDGYCWLDTMESGTNMNTLGPGSRVGSAVSLNSEYTSRSVGLISNDSSSDSAPDLLRQRQNLLRRYVSNPERPEEDSSDSLLSERSTKSWGNLQQDTSLSVNLCDVDRKLTEDSLCGLETLSTSDDISALVERTHADREQSSFEEFYDDSCSRGPLVTAITGDISLREGRIRRWLTDINDTND